jgi:cephalosporin hydroxylase
VIYHKILELLDSHFGFAMQPDDVMALECAIVEGGNGDYLEIGVKQGGSACFVGLLKRHLGQTGRLFGIDNLQNSHSGKDLIERSLKHFGVDMKLIVANSDPWPAGDINPVVSLIDGDHAHEWVTRDWKNLSPRTSRFILLHDWHTHPGVAKAIAETCMPDPAWRHVIGTGNMCLFEKR